MKYLCLGNRASNGGAIRERSSSSVRITNSSLTSNEAEIGGCVSVERSNLTILDSIVEGNNAMEHGGALFSKDKSALLLVSTLLIQKSAKEGGAIHATSVSSTIRDCQFIGNEASFGGTCAFQENSLVHAEGILLNKNYAYLESGDAIDINANSTLCATNLTIKGKSRLGSHTRHSTICSLITSVMFS